MARERRENTVCFSYTAYFSTGWHKDILSSKSDPKLSVAFPLKKASCYLAGLMEKETNVQNWWCWVYILPCLHRADSSCPRTCVLLLCGELGVTKQENRCTLANTCLFHYPPLIMSHYKSWKKPWNESYDGIWAEGLIHCWVINPRVTLMAIFK